MNLYDLFHATARRQPNRPLFLGPGSSDVISYAEADAVIRRAAAKLAGAGASPGACVALHCESGVDYVISTYAAWKCGACVLPIPTELTAPEKEEILRTFGIDFVISHRHQAAFLITYEVDPPIDLLPGVDILRVSPLREHPPGFRTINAAFMRFTSGTTATAKGVVLSHETIYERIHAANEVLGIGPEDRVVWLFSMAYHFAVTIVAYLSFGAGIILPRNHFAQAILDAARRHAGTLIYGSPTHFAWLASSADASPLSSLRLAISTTAAADRATAEHFRSRFKLPLTQALGIIEVGLPFINTRFAGMQPESIGELLPGYQLQLKDIGLGDDAREILLRGPGLLDAYYKPWRPRSAIMPDGWFHTGDVASISDSGCVTLRGRRKDVINALGVKFFPQEVESVLAAHPVVALACVRAIPHPHLGEVPVARIVLRPGCPQPLASELIAHCERRLALPKVPRHIEFVESLPRTANGKVFHRTAR